VEVDAAVVDGVVVVVDVVAVVAAVESCANYPPENF
jgi:hypothetical protein